MGSHEPWGVPVSAAYLVAMDHERQQVVLSIRGTSSLPDVVTDAAAATTPFFTGHCHNGIAWAAQWFALNLSPLLLHLLQRHSGYGLTVVGHSLGAGVAACLTLLLNDAKAGWPAAIADAPIQCFAYATPACATEELCRLSEAAGNIVTLVNEFDCVPRMSTVSTKVWRRGGRRRAVERQCVAAVWVGGTCDGRECLGRRAGLALLLRHAPLLWHVVAVGPGCNGGAHTADGCIEGFFFTHGVCMACVCVCVCVYVCVYVVCLCVGCASLTSNCWRLSRRSLRSGVRRPCPCSLTRSCCAC